MLIIFIIGISIVVGINIYLQNKRIQSNKPLLLKGGFIAWSLLFVMLFFIGLALGTMYGSILIMFSNFIYASLITQYGLSIKWGFIKSNLLGFLGIFPVIAIIPFFIIICSSNEEEINNGN